MLASLRQIMATAVVAALPLHAHASGCGGPYVYATGNEKVVSTESLTFDYARSGLRCETSIYSPDWASCIVLVGSSRFQVSLKSTTQDVFAQFAAIDGHEVYVEAVNLEYSEYDDCSGEETKARWWNGHHRVTFGARGPFYALNEDNLPPF